MLLVHLDAVRLLREILPGRISSTLDLHLTFKHLLVGIFAIRVFNPDSSMDISVLVHDICIIFCEYENRREIHG